MDFFSVYSASSARSAFRFSPTHLRTRVPRRNRCISLYCSVGGAVVVMMKEIKDGSMTVHRSLLALTIILLLVGCGSTVAPTATLPGATATVPLAPVVTPAVSSSGTPTRPPTNILPTSLPVSVDDTHYVDTRGRYTITVPKDWQLRAPTNPAGSVLVSFDAPDNLASMTITLETVRLGMSAKEFAVSTDKAIAGKITNYKKQGQDSLTVGNVPAEAITYQGTVGDKDYLFRQILLVQGTDGWGITFPLDPSARQRYGPVIDTIAQSFAFGKPLDIAVRTVSSASSPRTPDVAITWQPNTPIAAGVPVSLPDAGIVAQLNSVTFTTKAGGKATLGTDEQFVVAEITIWNLGMTDITPLPEQFTIAQERGPTYPPESAEVATDVPGAKAPPCGKSAIAPGMGFRGSIVARVPKSTGLLLIRYQPDSTRSPQLAQFYVKP